jgi:DNA-binding protein H-NS
VTAHKGVSVESLISGRKGTVPAKYRGPKGEEWSGRERLPQWVADVEKQGRKRDEFLIQK